MLAGMNRGTHIGLLALVALGLGGCSLAGTVAATAISALASGDAGPAREISPGQQLQEAISGIDDRVSASCSERLRRTERAAAGGPAPRAPTTGASGDRPAGAASLGPQAPAGPLCAIRPTCLPGADQPIPMMVCEHPPTDAGETVLQQTRFGGTPPAG